MSPTRQQTVFVVDDDAAVRDSIAELVESVGLRAEAYASATGFLDRFRQDRPGCLVLDVRMAEMSGLVLQQRLEVLGARIPVIVLTGHGDVPMAVQALKAGAVDFLQKPCRDQALLDSINAALAMDAAGRSGRIGTEAFDQRLASLTGREREVLKLLMGGESNKQIARALTISPRTVEAHRRNLLHKFGAATAKELMLMAGSPNGRK